MNKNESSQRKADNAYYERQKAKGIKIRPFRLNDEEFEKVKKYIKSLRK